MKFDQTSSTMAVQQLLKKSHTIKLYWLNKSEAVWKWRPQQLFN